MGNYLNPTSKSFQDSVDSVIYVDKSDLIAQMNAVVNTEQKFVCVSRPRRFGKSMAANMLAAYYGRGEQTNSLFEKLNISKADSYNKHLNQYDVIKVNMQEFLSSTGSVEDMLKTLQKRLIAELKREYPEYVEYDQLVWVMADVFAATKRPFVILIALALYIFAGFLLGPFSDLSYAQKLISGDTMWTGATREGRFPETVVADIMLDKYGAVLENEEINDFLKYCQTYEDNLNKAISENKYCKMCGVTTAQALEAFRLDEQFFRINDDGNYEFVADDEVSAFFKNASWFDFEYDGEIYNPTLYQALQTSVQ